MEDPNSLVGIAIVIIVLSILAYQKIKEVKSITSFLKRELDNLGYKSPDKSRYKNKMVVIGSEQVACIRYNEPTEVIDFEADYIFSNPSKNIVIAVNEQEFTFLIIEQSKNSIKQYSLLEVRHIEVVEYFDSSDSSKVNRICIKMNVLDMENPYYYIDFLEYFTKVNSDTYHRFRQSAETVVAQTSVLIEKAKKQLIQSTIDHKGGATVTNTFHINNAYNSIIGNQKNATVNTQQHISEILEMIQNQGGSDKETLNKMVSEIVSMLEKNDKVEKGIFKKYSELLEKHSWISGAVAQLTLGWLFAE